MRFNDLPVSGELKARLTKLAANGKFSHAYIVSGGSESARSALTLTLAAAVLCSGEPGTAKPCLHCKNCLKMQKSLHPDFITISRQEDKRDIYIAQTREILADLPVLPNEAQKKVYIINEADRMNLSAQNSILKALEEPPSHVCFILSAEKPGALLKTIRSRCAELPVLPELESAQDAHTIRANAVLQAFLEQDRLELLRKMIETEPLDKQEFPEFTLALCRAFTDGIRIRRGNPERLFRAVEIIESTEAFVRVNVGIKQITGYLAVKLNAI